LDGDLRMTFNPSHGFDCDFLCYHKNSPSAISDQPSAFNVCRFSFQSDLYFIVRRSGFLRTHDLHPANVRDLCFE
jgi:hypothetical protein